MKKRSEIFCDRLDAMKTPIDLWFTKAMEELDGMQKNASYIANQLRSSPRDRHDSGTTEESYTITLTSELADQLADRLDGKADRQYCIKIPNDKLAVLLGARHGAVVRRVVPPGAELVTTFVVLNPEDE